jgi:hypothetical protein
MADADTRMAVIMAKMDAARVKRGLPPVNPAPEQESNQPSVVAEKGSVPHRQNRGGDWRTDAKKLKELVDGTGGSITQAEASAVMRKVRVAPRESLR